MELKVNLNGLNEWFTTARLKSIFITYSIVLLLLAGLPINNTGSVLNNTYFITVRLDYIIHFIIYFVWMFLLWKMTCKDEKTTLAHVTGYVALGLIFALFTEGIQYFIPYRAFNINDLIANGLGIVLGTAFFIK